MYQLVILSISTLFLSFFKGRHVVGDMLWGCWLFIRRIPGSGVFVLPLLKRVRVCFKSMFLLINFKSLNEKGNRTANITCIEFINKCLILHLYNVKKHMFNRKVIAGFLDFK